MAVALTLPTPEAVLDYWGDDAVTTDDDVLTAMLQIAADLLWLACGLETDPTDPRLFRLEQMAIIDMAIYTTVQASQLTENYNNYSMESIGSYRYMKKLSAAALNAESGVQLFDKFVQYWLWNGNANGTVDTLNHMVDFESVFLRGVNRITRSEQLIHAADAQFEFGVYNGVPAVFVDERLPGDSPDTIGQRST